MASAAARLLRAYATQVEALRRLRHGGSQILRVEHVAARLLRAYATQVEALRRLRNGGSQTLRVEHVHVNEGGQAIIGNVRSGTAGEGHHFEQDEQ
jgi:predicted DNA-binding protein